MTEQKAIECIEEVLSATINYDESLDYQLTSFDIDWLSKAKETLAKQIPKKPIKYDKYYYKCPVCSIDIGVSEEDLTIYEETPPNFCKKCGQALDWSD